MTYYIMNKDNIVLQFDKDTKLVTVLNEQLLPFNIINRPKNYDMVKKFCVDRLMMLNRVNSEELLYAIGLDEVNAVEICIKTKGLSYTDNYWITNRGNLENWSDINLHRNQISKEIAEIGLTGKLTTVNTKNMLTGEYTLKGTKGKCVIQEDRELYLYKEEHESEINAEILSMYIAKMLGISCVEYWNSVKWSRHCSCSKLFTNERIELIPCRDILTAYNETEMSINGQYYSYFMLLGGMNFFKMQLFDYITLNTDRNRDNFGLLKIDGQVVGLSPLYDHDSCFKGISETGYYFVTGLTYEKTLECLKLSPYYTYLKETILNLKKEVLTKDFKERFLIYKDTEQYDNMLGRISNL